MRYIHGGIDRPLVITKGSVSIVTHQNWRGQFARGTYGVNSGRAAGVRSDCEESPASGCTPIPWPGERTTVRHELAEPDGEIQNWWGGLVDGMRDASGQMYMRNRYYDPASGQFTQPDPIGLAGGLNAYGFAAGDPVSFTDPYGLCAEAPGDTILVRLEVQCPNGKKGEEDVIAVRVTDPATIAIVLQMAASLTGGNPQQLPAGDVAAEIFDVVANEGGLYSFAMTSVNGNPVTAAGYAQTGQIGLRNDVLASIRSSNGQSGIGCGALGHEGGHHVLARNGYQASGPAAERFLNQYNASWRC